LPLSWKRKSARNRFRIGNPDETSVVAISQDQELQCPLNDVWETPAVVIVAAMIGGQHLHISHIFQYLIFHLSSFIYFGLGRTPFCPRPHGLLA
jgi:hypothetical protein